jgi:hypothetical protein
MSTKISDDSFGVSQPFATIGIRSWRNGEQTREGHYYSENGIVAIYADKDYTRLDFCYNGRNYIRHIRGQEYSDRGLSIMAGKFQREITNNE